MHGLRADGVPWSVDVARLSSGSVQRPRGVPVFAPNVAGAPGHPGTRSFGEAVLTRALAVIAVAGAGPSGGRAVSTMRSLRQSRRTPRPRSRRRCASSTTSRPVDAETSGNI
ncbi:hypothetical protein FHS42_004636 [Streptomyces zagrosensis]|uniref:Uncharacterized protein n=1 Tax=Streptomyces zagrosensis TaxID=1042984 RepID=A0A7W9QC55_9ACTN|nr:hypothetical protein [Streptomyces zagrosensis]